MTEKFESVTNVKSVVPTLLAITTIASSINKDPARVNRNKSIAARIRVAEPPQIPTIRNSGTRAASKKT